MNVAAGDPKYHIGCPTNYERKRLLIDTMGKVSAIDPCHERILVQENKRGCSTGIQLFTKPLQHWSCITMMCPPHRYIEADNSDVVTLAHHVERSIIRPSVELAKCRPQHAAIISIAGHDEKRRAQTFQPFTHCKIAGGGPVFCQITTNDNEVRTKGAQPVHNAIQSSQGIFCPTHMNVAELGNNHG